MTKLLSRRAALKGLGVTVALPWLEGMTPALSLAAAPAQAAPPKRLAWVYVPNGIHMPDWTPAVIGRNFPLPQTLQPLRAFRADISILSGLTCDKARPHGDGGGDHARAMSAFLTGCQARKTHGTDIQVGISADQAAAQRIGRQTRFPSLEIGCEGGGQAGNCDSGYSCAYSSNLSWRSSSAPNPKEINPRLVFDRLFGGNGREGAQARARREQYNLSILDFVTEDANRLMNRLGQPDQRRLDEYLSAVREVEQRINRTAQEGQPAPVAGAIRPSGIPSNFGEHIRLMSDLLALAFQTDSTRVATFVYAIEGSNRNYRIIDVPDGHHDLSHHEGRREKQEKIARINTFHIQQFAYLVAKLKDVREGDGTLLDNCTIVYGSGNSDGNRHNHDELPILVAGQGGGTFPAGRHLRFPRETPITNLWLSLLDRIGAEGVESLGDSTGRLQGLS